MKLNSLLPLAAAGSGLLLSATASAQVMTELRISTSGVDQEYAEIQGTAGATTDGMFILNVESDEIGSGGGAGTLDRIHDLGGNNFGTDGFFVVGSVESQMNTTFGSEIDLTLGSNMFENSSGTFYLVRITDANALAIVNASLNLDIRTAMGASTTIITTTPGIEVLDIVGIWDGDANDEFFDGAPVFGPDGPFLPSGIFRPGGCPNDWCSDVFLNFSTDGVTDPGFEDPSPGAVNGVQACMTLSSIGTCPGTTGTIGTAYCPATVNSTGAAASITAEGQISAAANDVTLTAADMPAFQFGIFLTSETQGMAPVASGTLCLGGTVVRFQGPGQILQANANGEFSLQIDTTAIPAGVPTPIQAGDTWNFQAWFRDTNPMGPTANFTNGVSVAFN